MPAPKTVTWELDLHTLAKHALLEKYLQAWYPIMMSRNKRVVVLDGFAGPGEYAGGERGSPIIAIETLLSHSCASKQAAMVTFLFIEQDSDRCEYLKRLLAARTFPTSISYQVRCGRFDDTMSDLLGRLEEQDLALAPTFAFIDPFGYSHTPMTSIARLMRHPSCEVFINFMYEEINRFLTFDNAANQAHYDRLFGTDKWRSIPVQRMSPNERERYLHDLYQRQLRSAGGATYVRSFRMRNARNQVDYYLFFGTKSLTGLDKMKQAMWRVDPSGAFDFSDTTQPDQPVLFAPEPDFAALKKMLRERFGGQTATVGEIEGYVIAETPFHSSHYKVNVLKPMELAGEVIPINPAAKRKRGTYGDESLRLRFA